MKLKYLLSSVILLLIAGCKKEDATKTTPNNESNYKLKQEIVYYSLDEKGPCNVTKIYEYDSLGRISRTIMPLYKNGAIAEISSYEIYSYNSENKLYKIVNYTQNPNVISKFINLENITYTYFENGNKVKELFEFPESGSVNYNMLYYSDNKLVKTEQYNETDELISYTTYKYDGAGKLTEETMFYGNSKGAITKHYYENGNQVKSVFYNSVQSDPIREITRTFDNNNRLVKFKSVELSMISSRASYVKKFEYYGDKGTALEITINENSTRNEDNYLLECLLQDIKAFSEKYSCDDSLQWKFTAIGSKPCGGPADYIAYSTKLDTAYFLNLVKNYSQLQEKYNEKWGIISDCSVTPPPQGVECENGKAVLRY